MKKSIKMGLTRGISVVLTICVCTLVAFAAQGLINRPLKTSVFGAMPVISSELENLISVEFTGRVDDGTFPYLGSGLAPHYNEELGEWISHDGSITSRNRTMYHFTSRDNEAHDVTIRVELSGDGVEKVWPQAMVGCVITLFDLSGEIISISPSVNDFRDVIPGVISTSPIGFTVPIGIGGIEVAFTGMHCGIAETDGAYTMTLVVEPAA